MGKTIKLTKEQRYTIYTIMLSDFQTPHNRWDDDDYTGDGYCYYLHHTLGLVDRYGSYNGIIEEQLPELNRKKPKELYSYVGLWFEAATYSRGRQQRVDLLTEVINELEKELYGKS